MIRVWQLIFSPGAAWFRIAKSTRPWWLVFLMTFLPLAAACIAFEWWGLTRWGSIQGELGLRMDIAPDRADRYAIVQIVFSCGLVFLGAQFLNWIAEGFHFHTTFPKCFILVAHALLPYSLGHVIGAFPAIPTWVAWAIGGILSVSVLYQGIALVLEPDQTKGFGMYFVLSLLFLLIGALLHFVALAVLTGRLWP